ncbi:DUF808 domain-containing protein [Mangrovibacterium diazotrophicum]|uniref:DUF808 domain-containing protein n=1 Tax=Mangrovibacterium diazotrophicum TaxID=1261403 RepID=A0A419W585_9BACT|nr:DUF808 domain-containing protein [Mangrovibacterium diazotrophicum]RKD90622.1 hypothetical protein BC643_0963 [Mangrovibacterium diazotrophicum]
MASGFFALFDDVATLMDDLATMSKIATKKTAGLLGDDLAVNAEKATGFISARELPVIWAITKGSFLNKMIILPFIIVLSIYAPQVVIPILLCGGLYLAYEGAEKIYEFFFHRHHPKDSKIEEKAHLTKKEIVLQEKQKIKSAIFTDFILSLEIIIVGLSIVINEPLKIQIPVLIVISVVTTIGVYGIVAFIVRLDDMGYSLIAKSKEHHRKLMRQFGVILVKSLPIIIKVLSVVGTIAMLAVAGGIYVHNIEKVHEWLHALPPLVAEILVGLFLGFVVLALVKSVAWLIRKVKK